MRMSLVHKGVAGTIMVENLPAILRFLHMNGFAAFKLLFAASTFIVLTACDDKTIDRDDLVERDGIFFEKFSSEPFTGLVQGKTSGVVEDGRWEGTVYEFHENGNLWIEGNYRDGVKEGTETIFSTNGVRVQEKTFSQGQLTNFKRFIGRLILENLNFRNKKRHGVQERFWDTGNLKYRVNYIDGELLENIVDVYSPDAGTHLKVPVFQNSNESPYLDLVAHGLVKVEGDDTCSVEYDKGHSVPEAATQALQSLTAVDCFVTVGITLDNAGLKSLFVKD